MEIIYDEEVTGTEDVDIGDSEIADEPLVGEPMLDLSEISYYNIAIYLGIVILITAVMYKVIKKVLDKSSIDSAVKWVYKHWLKVSAFIMLILI